MSYPIAIKKESSSGNYIVEAPTAGLIYTDHRSNSYTEALERAKLELKKYLMSSYKPVKLESMYNEVSNYIHLSRYMNCYWSTIRL